MSNSRSKIEWTDATWNPVVGCTHVSSGCDNCYAAKMTRRLESMRNANYRGLTVINKRGDVHFNGRVRCLEEALEVPLRWRKPRRIFVNSMSDLFHEDVPSEFIDRVFAVMALTPQHTYQILTKRPRRMAAYWCIRKPPTNVCPGTSCEDQVTANERIPHLLRCPAAVRFVSLEPLLGPIDLGPYLWEESAAYRATGELPRWIKRDELHWVIVGGESGPGARRVNGSWLRQILDQCQAAEVPFFFKQWGPRGWGAILDGREWREFPKEAKT